LISDPLYPDQVCNSKDSYTKPNDCHLMQLSGVGAI